MSDRSLLAYVLIVLQYPVASSKSRLNVPSLSVCWSPSIDRKGSHDFQQMSSVQAKSFGGGRTIALGSGEGAND